MVHLSHLCLFTNIISGVNQFNYLLMAHCSCIVCIPLLPRPVLPKGVFHTQLLGWYTGCYKNVTNFLICVLEWCLFHVWKHFHSTLAQKKAQQHPSSKCRYFSITLTYHWCQILLPNGHIFAHGARLLTLVVTCHFLILLATHGVHYVQFLHQKFGGWSQSALHHVTELEWCCIISSKHLSHVDYLPLVACLKSGSLTLIIH